MVTVPYKRLGLQRLTENGTWMSNYAHVQLLGVIDHPCPNSIKLNRLWSWGMNAQLHPTAFVCFVVRLKLLLNSIITIVILAVECRCLTALKSPLQWMGLSTSHTVYSDENTTRQHRIDIWVRWWKHETLTGVSVLGNCRITSEALPREDGKWAMWSTVNSLLPGIC